MRATFRWLLLVLGFTSSLQLASGSDSIFYRSGDPLGQRDSWGRLHQSSSLNDVDFAKRESWRLFYYSKSRRDLAKDPAYIGAVQVALERNGYYCGPIDGVLSGEVTDAIARMQKSYGMRVNGALTVAIRRALRLP